MRRSGILILLIGFLAAVSCQETDPAPVTPPEESPAPETDFMDRLPDNAKRLPVITILTDERAPILDKKNYVKGNIVIEDPDGIYWDTPYFTARMGIRGRGNSTWEMPKKPYKVKLDEAADLFGLGSDKEWVLLANYADKTMMRNSVAMKLSEIMEMDWTPAILHVELYLNDEYLGCYTFSEHKKVSPDRVALDVTDDVSSDYYLEIEQNQDETCCWWTERCGIPMMFSEPEEPTEQQEAYVKQYFADAEDALMGEDFADPINGYAAWIEPESFLKNYFVQEITKNIDGNMRKSTFITKKKDERLRMYHVWDFDITLGNSCFLSVDFGADNGPQGWFVQEYSCNSRPDMESYNWYVRLFQDPAFRSLAKSMWIEYKPDFDRIPEYIDYLAVLLDDAQKRNYECWNVLGEYVWPQVEIFQTYDEYVTYLKEFYVARIAWMDSQIMQW